MTMAIKMTKEEKILACASFYGELCERLEESHEVVGSCNNDISSYLIPKGTIEDLSYYGKPADSFRMSDHWNWFSSTRKCKDEHYVQCHSYDIPWQFKRYEPGKASKPRTAICVAYYGKDNNYHVIFGEKFDRRTKTWTFVTPTVDEVMKRLRG